MHILITNALFYGAFKNIIASLLLLLLLLFLKIVLVALILFRVTSDHFIGLQCTLSSQGTIYNAIDVYYHNNSSRYNEIAKGLGTFDLHSQLNYRIGE